MGCRMLLVSLAFGAVSAQEAGDTTDTPLPITIQEDGADLSVSAVMDSQWRWMHDKGGFTNCIDDATAQWDAKICPDPETCTKACAVEGLTADDYSSTYGVSANTTALTLKYLPTGSRLYILDPSGQKYKMFNLLNKEFTFTVDLSTLPCGTNAALYLVEMEEAGSTSAGAAYGTGYCDAQCPRAMKYVAGKANDEGWASVLAETPEYTWKDVGPAGKYGACCAEFDIFEANKEANALTSHPCSITGVKACTGDKECGNQSAGLPGFCDKSGCDFNPYRLGEKNFYGHGADFKVDTSKPFTVVTQFITSDGSDSGELTEIKRLYVQNGEVIDNAKSTILAPDDQYDSLTDEYCDAQVKKFNVTHKDKNKTKKASPWMDTYKLSGGMKAMGEAIGRGMVLVLSVWDDGLSRMNWLDSEKTQIDEDPSDVGVVRGPCTFESGDAKKLRKDEKNKDIFVSFSDLKVGPIGSTFVAAPAEAADEEPAEEAAAEEPGTDIVPAGEAADEEAGVQQKFALRAAAAARPAWAPAAAAALLVGLAGAAAHCRTGGRRSRGAVPQDEEPLTTPLGD